MKSLLTVGIIGSVFFALLVYVLIVNSATKIGKVMDPCQRAAAAGVPIPGCK